MGGSKAGIVVTAAFLIFGISGCTENGRVPGCPVIKPTTQDGWMRLSSPPAQYTAMLASLDKVSGSGMAKEEGFVQHVTWYKRSDDEYLAYTPPWDETGCWETDYIFLRSGNGWTGDVKFSCECVD